MQKARGQAAPGCPGQRPPTACRHTVSGTISLPSQGCFSPFPHGTGSLSVAGTYLALGDGPPGFPQGFTCPAVLRNQTREPLSFRLRGLHPVSPTIPDRSARKSVSYSPASRQRRHVRPCNTVDTTLAGLACRRFRLFPLRSPLLGESRLLSVPPGTEMVHFPGSATPPYAFRWRDRGLPSMGCPIRKSPGQSLFAAHRSLSQLTTSFIAVLRQGIHRTPLLA
jgi:hypothetical protein